MSNPLLVIDLDHLIHNVRLIESKTKKNIMAIIKSDAYGLGAKPIAMALVKAGVRYFVVNSFREAISLLEDDSVKNGLSGSYLLVLASLSNSQLRILDRFPNIIFSINMFDDIHPLKVLKNQHLVHLAIDTGMNRTGCKSLKEVEKIIACLNQNKQVVLDGIYTHFASSKDEYDYYHFQRDGFKKYTELYPFNIIHSANSASLDKPIDGNYVRIGISLYGYNSSIKGLKPVVYLYAQPINIIRLEDGEALGYDMTYRAQGNALVAVLPIGYNEGLLQGLKAISWTCGDREYSQIAKTCMNHSYLLVDETINDHSRFQLLGNNDKIDQIAKSLSCPVHQVLCQMSKIKKIYFMRDEYDISKTARMEKFHSHQSRKRKRSDLVPRFRNLRAR